MEFDHDKVRRVVEEDRLSSLPDELIHKIMSSFDMKFAVQTCLLSSRWEFVWTSMPYLNFSSECFHTLSIFGKFVTHVLSHRNHQIEVSSVKLYFYGSANHVFVKKIANYAFSHNVQELTVANEPYCHIVNYPSCLFSSQSLKHFTLTCLESPTFITPKTPWDFPALITMHLKDTGLCGTDIFSKCVNLKNLTLDNCCLEDMEVLDIITPRLSDLVLIDCYYVKVMNVIAPQLENLTIIGCTIDYLNAPLGISSLCYRGGGEPPLAKDRFHSLNKVTICMYDDCFRYKVEDACKTINMLKELHSVRYLTLSAEIIECLSSFPDLLLHHPSPVSNLNCLTIDYSMKKDAYKVKMSSEAINFLLKNSPSARFMLKLPKVRSRN